MKSFAEQHALPDTVLRVLPARRLPLSVVPKALPCKAAEVQRQSRRSDTCTLHAVRSDKQADQADSNTLRLIADITQ